MMTTKETEREREVKHFKERSRVDNKIRLFKRGGRDDMREKPRKEQGGRRENESFVCQCLVTMMMVHG